MLYWNSGPIWLVGGSRKRKALPPYGSSKIKFVDRLVASIFPSQDGCLSDITCLRHPSPSPPINLISARDSRSRSLEVSRAAERRARDKSWVFRASLCDWKEDQGSPSENIHMAHLPPPPPPQSSSLPETSRHTTGRHTRGERRDKKRFQVKCRLFFAAVCGAVVKICSCFWKKKNEQSTAGGKRPEH